MTHRRPDLASQIPSTSQLQRALSLIGNEIEDQPIRSSSLARIMRETFGGTLHDDSTQVMDDSLLTAEFL